MSECRGDPRQWIRDYQSRLETLGQRAQYVQQTVGLVRGHASDDQGVTVTVGSGGRIEAIDLDDAVLAMDARELSAVITRTIAAAQCNAASQIHSTLHDLTGDGPAMDYVKGYLDGGHLPDGEHLGPTA
jgi:DNA-binding protein YbaB